MGPLLGLAGATGVAGQDAPVTEGRVMIGFREVDVGGEADKYREDVNLNDGPRLMELDLTLAPTGPVAALVDRIRLDVDDLGGEPFESMRVEAGRYGSWEFRYARRESEFFYNDQLFPSSEESPRNARAGDFHTFDYRRVSDRADLAIEVSERASVTVGFDRYRKMGGSTRAFSFERDEFELERPVDESSYRTSVGLEYAWDRVTVGVEHARERYENRDEAFLPGRSSGVFPEDQTVLDYLFLEQPYETAGSASSLRIVATPTDRMAVRISGTLRGTDLDLAARESSAGTGFAGDPLQAELAGEGAIERDADLWDVDLTYRIDEQWSAVGGYYLRDVDQDGELVFGEVPRSGRWALRTRGAHGGVRWAPRGDLDLALGVLQESRDASGGAGEGETPEPERTESGHLGFSGTVGWRPTEGLSVTLDHRNGSIDDPFALASPTDRSRTRATVRYTLSSGFWASGSYQRLRHRNDGSGWEARLDAAVVRVGFRGERIETQAGYARTEGDRSYEAEVEGTFGPPALFDVDYTLASGVLDGLVRVAVAEDLWVGGGLRVHENDGSFGLSRKDVRLHGEYRFAGGYLARAGFRWIDYEEAGVDIDDYDASMLDLGVGFEW